MRTNPVFDSFFCTVIFLTAVVKSFPQEIADSDSDLRLSQGRSEESLVASQAEFNPPVLPSVPFWTEKTPDTEGSTDEDFITAFNVDQSVPVSSPNEVINGQAAQPDDCSSPNMSKAAKKKRATSCVVEPEQPPMPKIPHKPILNPNKKVMLHECPPNTFAFCCDASLYFPTTKSYGDCSNYKKRKFCERADGRGPGKRGIVTCCSYTIIIESTPYGFGCSTPNWGSPKSDPEPIESPDEKTPNSPDEKTPNSPDKN